MNKAPAIGFFLLATTGLSSVSLANDELVFQHKLINAVNYADHTLLTFQIRLSNAGTHDYTQLRIEHAGFEFNADQLFHVNALPAYSETNVVVEVKSNKDKAYFMNSMPLFFNIDAKLEHSDVSLVAYSEEY